MMRKWLVSFVILLAAICACAGVLAEAVALPESLVTDFEYSIADGEVTITKYIGNDADVVVPATIEGLPVTRIGSSAFSMYHGMKSCILPEGLISIDEGAFSNCQGLESCILQEGLLSIGKNAFEGCLFLKTIQLPEGLLSVGENAFRSCQGLESCIMQEGLLSIGSYAFYDCPKMESCILPEGLLSIGEYAFEYCTSLKTIKLPESLQTLGGWAFAYSGIMEINIPKNITEIPEYCFYACPLETLTIPEYVISIAQAALADTKLKSIVIPESVTAFGDYLFSGCTELTNVTLPSNMTELPLCAFSGCTSLESLTLPDSIWAFGIACFSDCTNLKEMNLPANLWHVPPCAFGGSYFETASVARVVSAVIKPGMSDFEKALALHDWLIYNANYDTKCNFHSAAGVLFFGRGVCQSYADAYALLLSAVGIPNSQVDSASMDHTWSMILLDGDWYHVDCTWDDPTGGGQENHRYFGLSDELMRQNHNWELPEYYPVANGTRYQYGVDNAPAATPTPSAPPVATIIPTATPAPTPAQPESSLGDFEYSIADGEVTITKYIGSDADVVVPATIEGLSVTVIGEGAFASNDRIATVSLPTSVYEIQYDAFWSCSNLTAVYGTENVVAYGNSAFANCIKLSHININSYNDIQKFGYYCFVNCALPATVLCQPADSPLMDAVTTQRFGEDIVLCFFSVENGEAALVDARYSTLGVQWHLNVPSSYRGMPVTAIAHNCVQNDYISGLTLPDSIRTIGEMAFNNCPDLRATIYTGGIVVWRYAFGACPGVTIKQETDPAYFDYTISNGEVTINKYTGSKTTVVIPATIEGLPVTAIGEYAFAGAGFNSITLTRDLSTFSKDSSLQVSQRPTLSIPASVKHIGNHAFEGCAALYYVELPSSLVTIGESAFASSGVKNIVIPKGTEGIATKAFANCPELTGVTIPYSVTSFGSSVFASCPKLVIRCPKNSAAEDYAQESNLEYVEGDSLGNERPVNDFSFTIQNGAVTITGYVGSDSDIVVPESIYRLPVTVIGANAFHSMSCIERVTLPLSVHTIEFQAFASCENLTAVYGTENVTSYGDSAFLWCTKLTEIHISANVTEIGYGAFMDCPLPEQAFLLPSDSPLRDAYGYGAFLTMYFFDVENGEAILVDAKCGNSDNWKAVVPATYQGVPVTTLGRYVFQAEEGLVAVQLPESIKYIRNCAFNGCINLVATINLEGVTLGEDAFNDCPGVTLVVTPIYIMYDYRVVDGEIILHEYKGTDTHVVVPATIYGYPVTGIDGGTFSNRASLVSIVIPDGVRNLCDFSGYTNLTEVTLPSGLTELPYNMFRNCTSLESVTLPDSLQRISECAFYGSGLKNIVLPDGVTSIGEFAFNECTQLESIVLPDGLISIDGQAFSHCSMLKSIVLPDSLTTIGSLAFYECTALETVTLSSSLVTIGSSAFQSSGITSIVIPESVNCIESHAFANCSALESVTIPDSVTSFDVQVFGSSPNVIIHCSKNSAAAAYAKEWNLAVKYTDGGDDSEDLPSANFDYTVTNGEVTITRYTGHDTDIVVPDMIEDLPVTVIGANVFNSKTSIETVTLPLSVHTIEFQAFVGCKNLTAVVGTDNVTSYGSYAFAQCTKLTDICISPNIVRMDYGAFMDCTLPEQVFMLPADSPLVNAYGYGDLLSMFFFDVQNGEATLTKAHKGSADSVQIELHIPATYQGTPVTAIGENAVSWSNWLKVVYLPETVHTIGSSAFSNCQNLEAVYGADNVTRYENFAFTQCTKLMDITINPAITYIGQEVFTSCPIPKQVFLFPSDSPFADIYNYGDSLYMYFFAEENGEAVLTGGHCGKYGPWKANIPATYQGMPVTIVGERAFSEDNFLTDVQLPDSIKEIRNFAFAYCANLNATIDVEGILLGEWVFDDCHGVTLVGTPAVRTFHFQKIDGEALLYSYTGTDAHVVIPDSFEGLPVVAVSGFSGNESLISVVIPDSIRIINNWAFSECSNLTEVTLPNSLVELGTHAFSYCTSLKTITLPPNVTKIGFNAFSGCSSLTNITLNEGLQQIGTDFWGCNSLESITIPGSVTFLQVLAFANSGLKTIVFEEGFTTISEGAFRNCSFLESVTLPSTLTTIGRLAFDGCSALTELTIPDSVTSIGANVFMNCSNLTIYCTRNSAAAAYVVANGISVKYTDVPDIDFTYTISNGEVTITGYTGNDTHVVVPAVVEDLPVTAIGESAFAGYTNLTTISTSGLVAIARDNVSAVTAVSIPASVTDIGNRAFEGCTALKNVELPGSLEAIGDQAFSGIPGIDVTLPTNIQHIGASAFDGQPQTLPVMDCPTAFALASGQSGSLYKVQGKEEFLISASTNAQGQKTFSLEETSATGSVSIPEGITTIASGLQKQIDNGSITSMSIPDSVQEIEIQINPENENFSIECSPGSTASSWATDNGVSWGCTQHVAQTMPGQAATCTGTGLTEGEKCSACGEILTAQTEIPALGHREGERTVVTEPTATTPGLAEYRCTVCGATLRTEDIPALGIARVAGDVDLDGDVNIFDALLILQYDVGWDVELELKNADVDADGDVNIFDALLILQYDVGWDVELL